MMRTLKLNAWCAAVLLAGSLPVSAQDQTTSTSAQPANQETVDTRPATTTVLGDTGLWFVPTGEVLPDRKFSISGYRMNLDRTEGFTDISNFPITGAVGFRDRLELFGSFRVTTRIDADRRPLVVSDGAPMDYPLINEGWETGIGDLFLGAKVNLASQWRGQPAAFAVRGLVKIPTGDQDKGLSTGEPDFLVDAIVSREMAALVEIAGNVGVIFRKDPSNIDLSNGIRWGVGVSVPSRSPLRLYGELHGEKYFDETVTSSGSLLPSSFSVESPVDAMIGLQYQHGSGFFVGGGLSIAAPLDNRSNFFGATDEGGDRLGAQVRIGFHPGVRRLPDAVAPAPAPGAGVPDASQAVANRPPTVKARCEPCTVPVGQTSTVTGDAQDPDGDPLTYKWSAPSGTFANPAERQTVWTAPNQEGPVPVTIAVDDGKGGTASDTVTIQVVRAAARQFTFEDVYFDFDRYSLRPEATRLLDEAVKAMQSDAQLRLSIEGHTCNIGTAEYNLALGERRASSVRDYLVQRGINASRLQTVSYGEERPKFENSREETRRLNRRAALTVRLQ